MYQLAAADVWSGNFIVKHGINFIEQKPQEFIEKVKENINMHFRSEERPLQTWKGFEKNYVNKDK